MTPAKRRPAKPASNGPTKDSAQEAPTPDAGEDSAPPEETGQVDPEDRAETQSPRRPLSLYPLPVWPD